MFVHANGLIHSSISPRNVYIDEMSNAYIDDLELSRIIQAARTQQELESLLDEPFYTSVEQLELKPVDFRSEMYNFGAILYHMLTGVPRLPMAITASRRCWRANVSTRCSSPERSTQRFRPCLRKRSYAPCAPTPTSAFPILSCSKARSGRNLICSSPARNRWWRKRRLFSRACVLNWADSSPAVV